MTPASILLRSV